MSQKNKKFGAARWACEFLKQNYAFFLGRFRKKRVEGKKLLWFEPRLGTLRQHAPREMPLHPRPVHQNRESAKSPRFSIVTPSFNQAAFIARTIDSVLDQNCPNLEYRVQDGGSNDGTVEILKKYDGRSFSRESKKDRGQAHAINRAFKRSTGDIMAWINSDDILLPGALGAVADYFRRHPRVDVLYGHRIIIDEKDRRIGRWILPPHDDDILSWADYVPQETLFWRRRAWEKAGGYVDEGFDFALDWDLLLRFRETGAKFARINRFIGAFRVHDSQKTSAAIDTRGKVEMDRLRRRLSGRHVSDEEIYAHCLGYLLKHVVYDMLFRMRMLDIPS
ncbi:Beta-1,6-glucanase [Candidatus Desulfarcum epimagneticum]|uniref:Beta-1,6-glucanase n=1 Tax=uncultured Desulfobacteraceae bacterium TaxID=218296 RepID=A0A484HJF7_9BACT|nr:Beta-1,6-glucanase [uncultured Desulfobacteraceae bacterium]